jgi:hypothetical protein
MTTLFRMLYITIISIHMANTRTYISNAPLSGLILHASVVWWSGFLATDPEVPGLIPVSTRFSEK